MMRFFKKESDVLWLEVECKTCQERIKVRINKQTDLQSALTRSGEGGATFTLKKEVLGNNCPNLMEVYLEFDNRYRILSKEIRGAELISPL